MATAAHILNRNVLSSALAEYDRGRAAEFVRIEEQNRQRAERVQELSTQVEELEAQLSEARSQLQAAKAELGDGASFSHHQELVDRIAILARVCRKDRHIVTEMAEAWDAYKSRCDAWEAGLAVNPDLARDVALVRRADTDPEFLSSLDELVRDVVANKLEFARASVAGLDQPTRPDAVGRCYSGEIPLIDGTYLNILVVPVDRDALTEGHQAALFTVTAMAAFAAALQTRTGVKAATSTVLEGGIGVIVAAEGDRPADDDRGYLAVLIEEELVRSGRYAATVEPIEDIALTAAIAKLVFNLDAEERY